MLRNLVVLALALSLALSVAPVQAADPSGTISVELKSVGAVLGASWGDGVLTFQGRTYAFKIKGLKVLTVGVRKLSANGDVYDLKAAADLAGTYKKADPAGLTFIRGEKGLVIKNDKGVVLNVKTVKKGLELDLVKEGLTIDQVK